MYEAEQVKSLLVFRLLVSYMQKLNSDLFLMPYTKVELKWIKDFDI